MSRTNRRPDAKWRAAKGLELHRRSWGNEYVVYHSGSGDTHLLNETGAVALQWLETNELTPMELCRKLSKSLDVEVSKDLLRKVRSLLEHYHRAGLVEPRIR